MWNSPLDTKKLMPIEESDIKLSQLGNKLDTLLVDEKEVIALSSPHHIISLKKNNNQTFSLLDQNGTPMISSLQTKDEVIKAVQLRLKITMDDSVGYMKYVGLSLKNAIEATLKLPGGQPPITPGRLR